MTSDTDRLTELELRYMEQSDLVETLNKELIAANEQVEILQQRVKRLEAQMEELLRLLDERQNEKPPHY